MSKLTEWRDSSSYPTLEGVYERCVPPHSMNGGSYSYWNGRFWCLFAPTVEFAFKNSRENEPSKVQNVRWRGYEERPERRKGIERRTTKHRRAYYYPKDRYAFGRRRRQFDRRIST